MTTFANTVSTREAYQLLKDVALEVRTLKPVSSSDEQMVVDIDGWQVTLSTCGTALECCLRCIAPDKRQGSLDTWQRYRTNPLDLMSLWERTQLQRLVHAAFVR
ncbi:MAG: hypothetical protein KGL60_28110 [Pseudomonas sp.]|jgi:hypothetical protein|uniref:DUF7693 family protein n=1 Tax=Pseudomonas sp. TaxID=306 RepID=UPI00239E5C91|nr:hypothetical protein [Pseudomonas sp.]MDP9058808.1 hypothetical protein [Pseudomonadota bacterium]MDE1910303.1 hypothetical protein [Pseudomonas sp.]MDE2191472.1 hypothetical protein [Pseudomonas sp.]MDE2559703.1 hypothetical protein [Pseudomonas sp.]MDP9217976.1 hypothetical protein [Pseudomonadota bacterium]